MPKNINPTSLEQIGWLENDIEFLLRADRDGRLLHVEPEKIRDRQKLARIRCVDSSITHDSVRHLADVCGHTPDQGYLTPIVPPGGPSALCLNAPFFNDSPGVVEAWRLITVHTIKLMQVHGRCGNTCLLKPHGPCAACRVYGVSFEDNLTVYTPETKRWLKSEIPGLHCPLWVHLRLGPQVNRAGVLEPDMKRTFYFDLRGMRLAA